MRIRPIVARFLTLALSVAIASAQDADLGRRALSLLSDRCFACHGPDAENRQAGLRLDEPEAAAAALAPGDPAASKLIQRILSEDPAVRMPPSYTGRDPLAADEVETLRRWVAQGAEYPTHWSFVAPVQAAAPAVQDTGWAKEPFDRFVQARLEAEVLHPSPEASPATWLRRMSLDLLGLPPSPEQMAAFEAAVANEGEAAYAAAVDQTLQSPHYGERMALNWLDVARYADTHGFNNDSSRSMWPWRDWVIGAFNRNLPYDRFIVEQLAGDLLEDQTLDQRIATGFNRNHVINSEGGIIDEEYRVEYVVDRVRTLGMAWLGLSIECARCHDHKFDPISQKDYYRFFAFFNNVPELGEAGRVANAMPMIAAPSAEQQARMAELEARIDALRQGPGENPAEKTQPASPPPAAIRVQCDASAGEPGVSGSACQPRELAVQPLALDETGDFTLSLWLRSDASGQDAALFSASDFSPEPASALHGKGVELRLADDEIELRLSKRFPAYSITVRSEGAGIGPGRWRHVAALYRQGPEAADAMRSKASWVRLFVDGLEVGTEILQDDLQSHAVFVEPYRLGHNNEPGGARFRGRLDELALWPAALSSPEIRAEHDALAAQPASAATELTALREELFRLRRNLPTTMVMAEMETPRETAVLLRGMYDNPGERVEPGVPEQLLGAWPEGAAKDRLGLARWLTRPEHPTTARVVVNRFWQQIFGVGLVKTSGDFGLQGEAPSHPRLLDWLAVDFIESGWDVKRLLRSIVLSATYRQDSSVSAALLERDPENRLLARGPRLRLPAEVIRDQALAVSGLLSDRIGGPSVRPYQPDGLYDGVVVGAPYPGTVWETGEGEELYRRSLYTFWKRTLPHPAMTVFDAPDREFCTVRRSVTNTPLQALTLLNDPTFIEASRNLAERVIREGGESQEQRIERGFRLAAGRAPTPDEMAVLRESLTRLLVSFEDDENGARGLLSVGASPAAPEIPAETLAAYTALMSMILNLDEVITKG